MVDLKFEKKESLSRQEAAALLAKIAEALASEGQFKMEREGEKLELDMAEEVRVEFEVEIEDDEIELELEIKWDAKTKSSAPDLSPPRPRKTQQRAVKKGQRREK